MIAGGLLILLPLAWKGRVRPVAGGRRMGGYFLLLGLAFLFIEIAFIQKLILFLGHPLYSVATALSGFLVFAGLGSAWSNRWAARMERAGLSPVQAAVAGIALIATAYLLLLPPLLTAAMGLPVGARVGMALALIAPLAFCMGMPFPLGLSRVARRAPDFIPWAWGINGFASVLSAALATLLAIAFGFNTVVLLALAFYVLAAALQPAV